MNKTNLLNAFLLTTLMSINCFALEQELHVYTEELPPFQTIKNNQMTGAVSEKVQRILTAAQLTPHINIVPWARAYNLARSTPNTLIYSMHRTKEREPFFHWLAVVLEIKNGFVAVKSRQIKLATIENAKTYVTAVVRGSFAHEYLTSEGFSENNNLLVVDSRESQFKLLMSQKVDFLFLDLNVVQHKLRENNQSPLLVEHVLTQPKWVEQLYLAINKNSSPKIITRLNNAVQKINTENQ